MVEADCVVMYFVSDLSPIPSLFFLLCVLSTFCYARVTVQQESSKQTTDTKEIYWHIISYIVLLMLIAKGKKCNCLLITIILFFFASRTFIHLLIECFLYWKIFYSVFVLIFSRKKISWKFYFVKVEITHNVRVNWRGRGWVRTFRSGIRSKNHNFHIKIIYFFYMKFKLLQFLSHQKLFDRFTRLCATYTFSKYFPSA